MNKKNNKYINILIVFISTVLYIFLMFVSNVTLDTGKKELENVILLALPCLILFVYSLWFHDKNKRKRIICVYLVLYFIVVIGFTFSNFRDNILINNNIMEREFNLIPFNSIKILLNSPLGLKVAFYNIIGNLLMLTPLAVLLPLLNDKYKNIFRYSIIIISIGLVIEILQYITKIGSLDIDDFILNVSGAILFFLIINKTIIKKYVDKLFYDITCQKKIVSIIYYLLLIVLVLIYIWYTLLIYQRYLENKFDYSNLICVNNEKTFIGTIGRYNYYSECKFDGYILRGNEKIYIDDIVEKLGYTIDEHKDKLKIIKEDSITDLKVIKSNNLKKLIYETDNYKMYFIDIDEISYTKNGKRCSINGIVEEQCGLGDYITILKQDISKGYIIQKGEHFNILSCIKGYYTDQIITDYYIPSDYKLDENSCSKLQ